MKIFKKVTSIVLTASIIAAAQIPFIANAETYPVTKTALVNVAENKPVTTSDYHAIPDYPVSNLVDGERGTFMLSECGPAEAASEVITVDLLRRCKIELVELYDRYDVDSEGGRQYIEIVGSNKADLSDAVVLGSLGAKDDTVFPHGGKLSFELNGESAYRYVSLRRTGGGDYQYAELRVWANQTVTDIARGIKNASVITDALSDTSHWIYDFALPENMFDGDTAGDWIEDGNAYRYMRVDLGSEYNIGMIEMTGRDYSGNGIIDNEWARKYINIYGTNNDSTENSIYDAYSAPNDVELENAGFKRLIKLGRADVIDGEHPFPAYFVPSGSEATYGNPGYFQATCDDTQSVRYLVYKTTLEVGTGLSSFRAYVVHPEAFGGAVEGNKVILNFSDEMDIGTLSESTVKVYVDNVQKTVTFNPVDDYTLSLELDKIYYDAKIRVELSGDIKNQKNVTLAQPKTFTLVSPAAIEVKEFKIQDEIDADGNEIFTLSGESKAGAKVVIKNNLPDGAEKAVVFVMAFDANNTLLGVNDVSVDLEPGEEETVYCGLDFGTATPSRFTAFIWRDYGLMKPWIDSKTIR